MPVFNKTYSYLFDVWEQWAFGLNEEQKISWPSQLLLALQLGLCSIELVQWLSKVAVSYLNTVHASCHIVL